MGNRRKSRARLAAVQKAGAIVASGVSPLMANALISADQQRVGQMLITDLVFDLGTSKTTLNTPLAADVPIGSAANASAASFLCRLNESVFGKVTLIETAIAEQITDGTQTTYDIRMGTAADGSLGTAPTGDAAIGGLDENINDALGKHTFSDGTDDDSLNGDYLYLVTGAATTQRASCTITVTDATIGNVTSGITTLRLRNAANSANIDFVADSGTNWDAADPGTTAAGKFGIGNSMNNIYKLTQAISLALHTHGGGNVFDTDAASRSAGGGTSVSTITVTRSQSVAANANENTTNQVTDGVDASGITMTDFSGGAGSGATLTAGKLIVRITGFADPEDI